MRITCMKKNSSLLATSIGVALTVLLTSHSYAETSTELDEIEVVSTATRTEQPIEGVAASVIVVDSNDIKKWVRKP